MENSASLVDRQYYGDRDSSVFSPYPLGDLMEGLQDYLFYILGILSVASALGVVLMPNPIYAALFLAGTMISFSALFFLLGAYFVAGAQLIVYAGAVMVLFVMVVMLFDLRHEKDAFSSGATGFLFKIAGGGALLGVLMAAFSAYTPSGGVEDPNAGDVIASTRALATLLFTKYVFAFEVISILLLLVVVGSVAIARSRGGTHV
jgi:NADH-quinone oxidoreductase subunit J